MFSFFIGKRKITIVYWIWTIPIAVYVFIGRETTMHYFNVTKKANISTQYFQNNMSSYRPTQKRQSSAIDLLWHEIGGFKGTRFDDRDQVRQFFKDRPAKSKIILRVGSIDFGGLGWSGGGMIMRQIDCPVKNCFFTSNLSAKDTADALVISEFGKKDHKVFAPKMKNQIWVAQIVEPPHHVRLHSGLLNGLINWTATYRRDSTFAIPYSLWIKKKNSPLPSAEFKTNYASGRTKQVAMFVSNCRAISGRVEYAVELNKTIPVDIFGKCGSLKCPRGENSCFQMLRENYKFYLSFENSNCAGYITEKLYANAMSNDLIPIVMGARPEDYEQAVPPGSFIHVDDFQSPHHLGEYLNLLDNNDTLYNEYFRFKGHYSNVRWRSMIGQFYYCQLCIRLHLMEYENFTNWYDDFDQWWTNVCTTKHDGNNTWKTWKT